jgi:hypothetical protein
MEFRDNGASVVVVDVVVVVVVVSVLDLPDSVVENLPNLGNFGRNPDGSGVVLVVSGDGAAS